MPPLSLPARFLRFYLRNDFRGQWRLTSLLSHRIKSLHHVPVEVGNRIVFVDLRLGGSLDLLKGSPWDRAPFEICEQEIMRMLVRPTDTVFDIGANIGLHTLLLADLAHQGKVFAFEPNPELLPCLRLTISRVQNAELIPYALSDKSGTQTLFIPDDDHMMSSFSDWSVGSFSRSAHTVNCETITLDDLLSSGRITKPDFIKCDVEGAEARVFRGATEALNNRDAPIVLFEINSQAARTANNSVDEAVEFLRTLDRPKFTFYKVEGRELVPFRGCDGSCNVVAVPANRLTETISRF